MVASTKKAPTSSALIALRPRLPLAAGRGIHLLERDRCFSPINIERQRGVHLFDQVTRGERRRKDAELGVHVDPRLCERWC